jgi:hypothetical protein
MTLQPKRPDAHWTDDRPAWDRYWSEGKALWAEIDRGVARQIPSRGITYVGGGTVLEIAYEDRSYAWIGGDDEEDCDGPWADGTARWVGGYRYDPDSDGERFTERLMLQVPDPEDIDSIIDTVVKAARRLGTLPFTEYC